MHITSPKNTTYRNNHYQGDNQTTDPHIIYHDLSCPGKFDRAGQAKNGGHTISLGEVAKS